MAEAPRATRERFLASNTDKSLTKRIELSRDDTNCSFGVETSRAHSRLLTKPRYQAPSTTTPTSGGEPSYPWKGSYRSSCSLIRKECSWLGHEDFCEASNSTMSLKTLSRSTPESDSASCVFNNPYFTPMLYLCP